MVDTINYFGKRWEKCKLCHMLVLSRFSKCWLTSTLADWWHRTHHPETRLSGTIVDDMLRTSSFHSTMKGMLSIRDMCICTCIDRGSIRRGCWGTMVILASCIECIHVSWCTTVRNKSIIIIHQIHYPWMMTTTAFRNTTYCQYAARNRTTGATPSTVALLRWQN